MSDIVRWPTFAREAGVALAVVLGMAMPAQARGIVADQMTPPSETACNLGQSSCSIADFVGSGMKYDLSNYSGVNPNPTVTAGAFANVYIYKDGIASFGALPSTASLAGGLTAANLGNNYIAPGFSGFYSTSGANEVVRVALLPDDNGIANELRVYWIFTNTHGENIFGMDLMLGSGGKINAAVDWGAGGTSWFGTSGYCDTVCNNENTSGNSSLAVYGVDLPADALVGSSYPGGPTGDLPGGGVDSKFAFDGVFFPVVTNTVTASVPEPSTWAMTAFGLLSLGLLARRGRKRARAAG